MALSDKALATRQRILSAATELFYLQGYNATGLDQVITKAGVTKGNFYYHFKSKESLAVATLDWQFDLISKELKNNVFNKNHSALSTLLTLLQFMSSRQKQQHKEGFICGCYFGNFTLELSTASQQVRNKVSHIFQQYVEIIESLLKQAQEANEIPDTINPSQFSPIIMAQIEGAIMLDKAQQQPEHVDSAVSFIKQLLTA